MKFKEYLSNLYKNITPRLEEGKVTVCSAVMLLSIGVIIYVLLGYEPASDKWLNRLLAIYTVIGGGGLVALSCFWEEFACKIRQPAIDHVLTVIELKKRIFVDAAREDMDWANQVLDSLSKEFDFVRPLDPNLKIGEYSRALELNYQHCRATVMFCKKVPNLVSWVNGRLGECEKIKTRRVQPPEIAVYTTTDSFVSHPRIKVTNLDCNEEGSLKKWLQSLPNQSIR